MPGTMTETVKSPMPSVRELVALKRTVPDFHLYVSVAREPGSHNHDSVRRCELPRGFTVICLVGYGVDSLGLVTRAAGSGRWL